MKALCRSATIVKTPNGEESHHPVGVEHLKQFLFVRSKVVDFKLFKNLIYRSNVFDFSFFLPKFRQKFSSIYFNKNLRGVRTKDVDFNFEYKMVRGTRTITVEKYSKIERFRL